MRILNLYAGIGGNRKLWPQKDITAVELDPKIAQIYQDFFPKDKVIVADAHQYLLDHFQEFDFIWSSPPCPSHSRFRRYFSVDKGKAKAIYPDMKLYEEILFLQHYFKGKFVVENVISYYKPLITPAEIQKHYFWSNFFINKVNTKSEKIKREEIFINPNILIDRLQKKYHFNLSPYKLETRKKRTVLRNCVEPELGLHIFQEAFREYQRLF